jgi:glycosyltransferase involved in cell wall biosynthesis
MKIGIDARFYGTPGKGLGRYTEKLIRELEALPSDHTYHIFLSPEGYALYHPHSTRFIKHQVPFRWYGVSEQLLYPWLLLWKRLDLMHFPHFNVPLLYSRPFIVTVHDLILFHFPTRRASTHTASWYWLKYWAYKRVIKSALKRARTIIAVSQFTRRDLERVYPFVAGKISVTLEGVEPLDIQAPVSRPGEELKSLIGDKHIPYLLYVGNAYPHKNLDVLLSVAQAIAPTRIVLVGKRDYFYEALQAKAKEQQIENVCFIGSVDDYTLAQLYRGASLYLFPSLYEGFGLPPLEAMVYGTPVIASRCGSLPEILGEAAYLVAPDAPSFLVAIRELLADPLKQETLRERGFQKIREYSWQAMAKETLTLYNKSS